MVVNLYSVRIHWETPKEIPNWDRVNRIDRVDRVDQVLIRTYSNSWYWIDSSINKLIVYKKLVKQI
jgi:hypothetical protein